MKLEFELHPLNIRFFINRLKENKPFMFLKILHGFWEKIDAFAPNKSFDEIMLDISRFYQENQLIEHTTSKYLSKEQDNIYDSLANKTLRNDDRHYFEVLHMIKTMNLNDFILGVHYKPWPNSVNLNEMSAINAMNKILPGVEVYNGHVLKHACINGEIMKFIKELRNYHVVVIGLYHLENVNHYFHFDDFTFYGVETPLASRREQFLMELKEFHENLKTKKKKVYLVQLGGSLTAWIGYKGHHFLKDSFFIDMGRAIDIWGAKETTPHQFWLGSINNKLMEVYKNKQIKLT